MSITNPESGIIPHNTKLKGRKMVGNILKNVEVNTKSIKSVRTINIKIAHVKAI
jgi:hypothetical protein